MPAAMPHPVPDASGAAGRPDRTARPSAASDPAAGRPSPSPAQQPEQPPVRPDDDCALLAAPFLGGPEQGDVLDWEWAALPHEDPSVTYPDEDELEDYEEWLAEVSHDLTASRVPAASHTGLVGRAATSGAAAPEHVCPTAASPGPAPSDPACTRPAPSDRACPGPASPDPAPASPRPRDFAVGGAADAMAPGPELAALADQVWQQELARLDDDQLTGVLQAANRLAAWSAALRVAAVSGLAARREAAGRESADWRPFDHIDDEVAMALTLTRRSGGRLVELALGLDRLPLTRAALAAGLIDERRAEVIAEELSGLDDEHAAAVEDLIIGKAPGLTSGQLRALARRAVLSADPKAARERKEKALKDARVETFPETAGTAALSGRDLPPAAVLAADKHLTALAQALQAAGIPGTLDTLRARAYLHLLTGQPTATLILQTTHPGRAAPSPGAPAAETAGNTAPASTAPNPGPGPGPGPGRGGLPGLRGTVNLTMPLSAWLGWTQSPGDVPGYGPLDADDSRTLAGLLAHGPRQPVVRHPHRPRRAPHRPRLRPPRPPRPTPAADYPTLPPTDNPTPRDQPNPGDQPNLAPPDPARPEAVLIPGPRSRTGCAASPSPPCKARTAPTTASHAVISPAGPCATSSRSAIPPAPAPAAAGPPTAATSTT